MTFINWVSIGVMAALVITGVTLYRYFRKKVKDIDGFGGIMKGDGESTYREEPER